MLNPQMTEEVDGVEFIEMREGYVVLKVKSGTYNFEVNN